MKRFAIYTFVGLLMMFAINALPESFSIYVWRFFSGVGIGYIVRRFLFGAKL